MKKLLFLIGAGLVFVMLFSGSVWAAETVKSGACPENIEWSLDDTGVLTIRGTGVMHYSEEQARAPWEGLADSVLKVVVQEGIIFIDNFAFMGFEKLEEIELPEGLTGIGNLAFADCRALKEIVIPDSVEAIGLYAFSGCTALEYVTFGNSILRAEFLFDADCPNLKAIFFNGTKKEWFTPVKVGFTSYRPIIGLPESADLIFLGDTDCTVYQVAGKTKVLVKEFPSAKAVQVLAYDQSGRLIGVKTISADGKAIFDTDAVKTVKVYVWNQDYVPIAITEEV